MGSLVGAFGIEKQKMRRLCALFTALTFGASVLLAQHFRPALGSPEEVLDKYYKMVNDGDLLTRDGWNRAARLFVKTNPRPKDEGIFVITGFPLGNGPMTVKGDQAEADQKWVDTLGTIDSAFRFHPPPKAQQEFEFTMFVFHLVRTEKHWQILADGISEKEVSGPPEWRIEESPSIRWASRKAAIRYVTEMRDKTTDPAIRDNADETIAKLKGLPAPRTHI